MIKRYLTSLLLTCMTYASFATGENIPVGGRAAGMGNASVTFCDFWAIHHNQAGLTGVKAFSAGIYYENRFGLKNLGLKSGAIVYPTKSGVFGLSMTSFGYSMYNESKIGLAYAKAFGDRFSAGVQLDYLSTHIAENYGNSSAIAAEVGLIYKLNKNLSIGAHVYNPTKAKTASYNDERAPTIVKLGLAYSFSEKVTISVESDKDIQYDPEIKAGIEYHPVKKLYFRTGISTNPVLNSFGFGLEFKNITFDFATSYHQTLGFTPQFSMIFHITNPKENL
ncbi:MAG: hypothetical protein HGB12_03980 [Bacteroidetes bacterium]|nr:hypothetical protein [Bacteroidota bacterium]